MSERILGDSKGYFWNSEGEDRIYDASSFGKWLSTFFTTGVKAGDLNVRAQGNNMNVVMSTGYSYIDNPLSSTGGGKSIKFEEEQVFTLALADNTRPRIDTIVIERNDNNREFTAKLVTGTPALVPTATPPVRTTSIYQLVIAEIYVTASATSISDNNITRKVGDSEVCGLITGTISNNSITYGTEDLTPGVSELADGTFYFVYE